MKITIALLAFVAISQAVLTSIPEEDEIKNMFNDFKVQYKKYYASEEDEAHAYSNFRLSIARSVMKNNDPADQATYGITKFSDLSPTEFKELYLMKNHKLDYSKGTVGDLEPMSLPSSYNWVDIKGVVTKVKNQGQCGSCWAFSVTENIESIYALANNTLTALSSQQIVSCDHTDLGCDGGEPTTAYEYVMKAGGIESDADYPYTSANGNNGQCKFNSADIVTNIDGYNWATQSNNETAMQAATLQWGPLSVCVDAASWMDYQNGIITSNCGNQLDHCVMVTGFNTAGSTPYWIVRNSWSDTWGMGGYLWVELGRDMCGIAQEATSSYIN